MFFVAERFIQVFGSVLGGGVSGGLHRMQACGLGLKVLRLREGVSRFRNDIKISGLSGLMGFSLF